MRISKGWSSDWPFCIFALMTQRIGKYYYRRKSRPFATLIHGARVLLDKSKIDEDGSAYTNMSAILLACFAFEAFVNDALQRKRLLNSEVDRQSTLTKLDLLCEKLGIKFNKSTRPYQTLKRGIWYRNQMAHPKTELLTGERKVSADTNRMKLSARTDWEEYGTFKNAEKTVEDIRSLVDQIHADAKFPGSPYTWTQTAQIRWNV